MIMSAKSSVIFEVVVKKRVLRRVALIPFPIRPAHAKQTERRTEQPRLQPNPLLDLRIQVLLTCTCHFIHYPWVSVHVFAMTVPSCRLPLAALAQDTSLMIERNLQLGLLQFSDSRSTHCHLTHGHKVGGFTFATSTYQQIDGAPIWTVFCPTVSQHPGTSRSAYTLSSRLTQHIQRTGSRDPAANHIRHVSTFEAHPHAKCLAQS